MHEYVFLIKISNCTSYIWISEERESLYGAFNIEKRVLACVKDSGERLALMLSVEL